MDTRENALGDEERRAEMLERSIAEQRQRINRTVDELGLRLQPRHLLDDLLGQFRSGGTINTQQMKESTMASIQNIGSSLKSGVQTASEQMRRNAWPALAIGAAAGWWIYNEMRGEKRPAHPRWSAHLSSSRGSTVTDVEQSWSGSGRDISATADKVKEQAAAMKDRAGNLVDAAGHKFSDMSRSAGDTGSRLIDQGKRLAGETSHTLSRHGRRIIDRFRGGAERRRSSLQETYQGAPLLLGIGSVAAGFLIGLVLPRTRREDELLGRPSDRFEERLKEAGRQFAQQGADAVRSASENLQQELREQGEELKERAQVLKDKSKDIGEQAGQAAKEGMEQAADRVEGRPNQ